MHAHISFVEQFQGETSSPPRLMDPPMTAPVELDDRAEINGDQVLVKYSRTEAELAELRERHQGAVFDLATTAGDKAARAARLELVSLRGSLERRRKAFKAPALEFGRQIDAEAARISAEILALENPINDQIKADERRREAERAEREGIEAARVAKHRSGIDRIRGYTAAAAGKTAEQITNALARLATIDCGPAAFEEFSDAASEALGEVSFALQGMLGVAQDREAEQLRLEQQRAENEREAAKLAEVRKQLDAQALALRRSQEALDADKMAQEAITKAAEPPAATQVVVAVAADVYLPPTKAVAAPVAMLTLGKISDRLDLGVTREFLRQLGFEPPIRGATGLYYEHEFPAICAAIAEHVVAVGEAHAQ